MLKSYFRTYTTWHKLLLFGVVSLMALSACTFKNKEADIIFHNAKIYTADNDFSVKEAMAIKDGRIVAVGTEREILNEYRSKKTVDCQKQFIYPGFIDGHCHFMSYARSLQELDLSGTRSFDEVLGRIDAYHRKFPQKEWIIGRGWDQNDWKESGDTSFVRFPDNTKLNELYPDIPIVLSRVDGHALLANNKALELADITKATPITGGMIETRNGKLTGILIDNAMKNMQDRIPELSDADRALALANAQENCFAVGLTTVDDAGLMLDDIRLIKELHKEGKLKMRIYAMMSDAEENFSYYQKNGIDTSDFLTVRAFKFYADGALGSRGACLLSPYSDVKEYPDYGFMLIDKNYLKQRAEQLYDMGFQVCTHAIGDSANRVVLGIYADVLGEVNDRRWRIEHAQVIHENDFSLFSSYSIIPSVQPTHATSDMYWAHERLGKERMKFAYAYNDLKYQLGLLALGTDFPVEGISPLRTFYAAVFRKDENGFPQEGFQMENALSREDALRGITIWPAIANFEEDKKGSLEVGKFADFVMLDTDLMNVSSEMILRAKVLLTVLDGEPVYQKNE